VQRLTPQLPTRDGDPDPNRQVELLNFHTLDYLISDDAGIGFSATGGWALNPWERDGSRSELRDPYFRTYFLNLLPDWGSDFPLYWYADVRVHPGVTTTSRDADQIWGIQVFQAWTWQATNSRWGAAFYLSFRQNFFGSQGLGIRRELYSSPGLFFRHNSRLTSSLLLQLPTFQRLGSEGNRWETMGLDLEPGLSWDLLQNLNLTPFLTIPVSGTTNRLKGTSLGLTLSWNWF